MNFTSPSHSFVAAAVGALMFLAVGCGIGKPEITNTQVEPKTWAISGIADTVTFKVTTDVLRIGGKVTKVSASVEGQNVNIDLAKQSDVVAGERWGASTKLTLWSGVSKGTYQLRITATDDKGNTVSEPTAATVTVTD